MDVSTRQDSLHIANRMFLTVKVIVCVGDAF